MARTVRAAILLSAMTGEDSRDTATILSRVGAKKDYTEFLSRGDLRGVRLGAARNQFGSHERVSKVMEDALQALRELGAEVIDVELPNAGKYDDSEFEVLLYEFKAGLNACRGARHACRPAHARRADRLDGRTRPGAQYFGQEIFERAEKKGPLTDKEYKRALASNLLLSRDKGIDQALAARALDALIASTGGPSWTTDLLNGDHYSGGFSTAAAVAGYPHITVPAGDIHGLPVGISFFSTAWRMPMSTSDRSPTLPQ
jgi:amidase